MCGIAVAVTERGPAPGELVRAMCDRLVHRGPDAEGYHVAPGVGLGMRRLKIIDLEGGDQPVYNEDRSLAVVFNGEIYNYRELRAELEAAGHRFRSASDTEVIVHLWEDHGEAALARLRGMFAIAIHERDSGRVVLARDRLGIKPLHYADAPNTLYAASELKAFAAVPGLAPTLDPIALDQLFALSYVPAPRTIFREIRKLPPGHLLVKERGRPAVVQRYWRLQSSPIEGRDEQEWIDEFRARFDDAVASHLVADVPLGVFLSGGVDSSGIVAAMARAGATVNSFSLGFGADDRAFDERRYARLVAERFGTNHEELVVEPEITETIHTLAGVFDEPLGDSGAVPNFLVCQAARKSLTVALSGLGGDELAGGYQRHLGVLVAEWYRRLPALLRDDVIKRVVDALPEPAAGGRRRSQAKRFLRHAEADAVEHFMAFAAPLDRERRRRLYSPALAGGVELDSSLALMRALAAAQPTADALNRILCVDLQTAMVDDLLAVADRTSMAVSLELRVPFLDHQLVEFMARVPGRLKIRRLEKKYLLKRAFAADVPREVLFRRKAGFSLPVARWLREDLRGLLDEVLSPERIRRDGLFDPAEVETLKREHASRRQDWSTALWTLLTFHLWLARWGRQ